MLLNKDTQSNSLEKLPRETKLLINEIMFIYQKLKDNVSIGEL